MDSLCSDILSSYDNEFKKLLEVKGNFIHRLIYRKAVKHSKEFYDAYVKKCMEYDTYIDFFNPLCYHLICCGIKYSKIQKYFSEIRYGILNYLRSKFPDDIVNRLVDFND